MQLDRAVVGHPRQRRRASRARSTAGSRPASASSLCQRVSQSGACDGTALCQKPGLVDAVGEAVQVHRPAGEVGQHRGRHAAWWRMRSRLVTRLGSPSRREQHLVEVGELQRRARRAAHVPLGPERVEGGELVGGRRRPRSRRSTSVAAGARLAPRRWCGRSSPTRVVLGVPARHRVRRRACAAAATAPCRRSRLPGGRARSGPASFSPYEVEVEVAGLDRGRRGSSAVVQAPRCPSPTRSRRRRRTRPRGMTPSKSK